MVEAMMVSAADLGLTETQLANAYGIVAAVQKRGLPQRVGVIAVETVLTESGMRILASANVPESVKYPHELLTWSSDGLGHDHASMGMYQQQTGYAWVPAGYGEAMNQTTMDSPDGWGTPAELMNAELSTTKFLDALQRVDWQSMTNWQAAQAVQRSAFPDGSNYLSNDARAQKIVSAIWSQPASQPVPQPEEDEEMLIIKNKDKVCAPILVSGGRAVTVTAASITALRAVGVKYIEMSDGDYGHIRSQWA